MERLLEGLPNDGLERVLAAGCDQFRTVPWSEIQYLRTAGKGTRMRIVVSDFISLDGVVQAPGDDNSHRHRDLHLPARRALSGPSRQIAL
jgi:hypothetical protein